MNTLIIEHADQSTTELFRQLVDKLGLSMKTKTETVESGVITNPELLKRIEDLESGKGTLISISDSDWEKLMDKHD